MARAARAARRRRRPDRPRSHAALVDGRVAPLAAREPGAGQARPAARRARPSRARRPAPSAPGRRRSSPAAHRYASRAGFQARMTSLDSGALDQRRDPAAVQPGLGDAGGAVAESVTTRIPASVSRRSAGSTSGCGASSPKLSATVAPLARAESRSPAPARRRTRRGSGTTSRPLPPRSRSAGCGRTRVGSRDSGSPASISAARTGARSSRVSLTSKATTSGRHAGHAAWSRSSARQVRARGRGAAQLARSTLR